VRTYVIDLGPNTVGNIAYFGPIGLPVGCGAPWLDIIEVLRTTCRLCTGVWEMAMSKRSMMQEVKSMVDSKRIRTRLRHLTSNKTHSKRRPWHGIRADHAQNRRHALRAMHHDLHGR
jgi:hypothetical protein